MVVAARSQRWPLRCRDPTDSRLIDIDTARNDCITSYVSCAIRRPAQSSYSPGSWLRGSGRCHCSVPWAAELCEVHLRNSAGRTPLFLAASAGLTEHVVLLRKSGARLHADERPVAEMQARARPGVWALAGVRAKTLKEREQDEGGCGGDDWMMAGSAP